MIENNYLDNQFIIAMPTLTDDNFSRSAIYLCQHNADGALGIVINRKSNMKLKEIFMQMDIPIASRIAAETPVYVGASSARAWVCVTYNGGEMGDYLTHF